MIPPMTKIHFINPGLSKYSLITCTTYDVFGQLSKHSLQVYQQRTQTLFQFHKKKTFFVDMVRFWNKVLMKTFNILYNIKFAENKEPIVLISWF